VRGGKGAAGGQVGVVVARVARITAGAGIVAGRLGRETT
jgi:hypothetical protein